nr:putative reverse transcriptase domain-containing protein [Tanacetum cinerariifolium]
MQATRERQKSYTDLKRKPMEFQVRDKVMLKVSTWKGVVRFGKQGKLNPRYVGPFMVLERIGDVAYKLDLPKELSRVHNTFHVSNLKKCHADEPLAVPLDGLHFDDKLHFEEIDFEDISQIQDVVLREKLLSITRLIANIESLNGNSTPDRVFNSFASDNSLLDNFSPEFETFCDHSEETRSGNTTHADNSLPEYDSFRFETDQERNFSPLIEAFLCWIFVRFPRSSYPFIDSSLGKSKSFDLY